MSKNSYKNPYKNEEYKCSEREFRARITISLFCIVACMIVMLSSAYAWFTIDISSNSNMIQSANYSLSIEPIGKMRSVDVYTDSNGTYKYDCELTAKDKYIFLLTADGTAENGYCKILVTGEDKDGNTETEVYYTDRISTGDKQEVVITAACGSSIEFIPTWGMHEGASTLSLRRDDVFRINHSRTPYVEYEVEEGVTLEELADYYGVSVEDICIYNDIEDLVVGDVILIPGVEDDSIGPYKPVKKEKATPTNAIKVEKATSTNAKKIKNEITKKEIIKQESIKKATPSNVGVKSVEKKQVKADSISSSSLLKIASDADASETQ